MKKLALILTIIIGITMAQEKQHYGFEYVKESRGIKEYLMTSNGLRVLLKEDHSAPVATLW